MKILGFCIALLLSVTLWGCGKGNSNAPVTINPVTQKHLPGWAANGTGGAHPDAYFANAGSCEECHGKIGTEEFITGGISKVSCSNPGRSGVACHPSFPHVADFKAVAKHGNSAKDIASGVTGMAHCQKCHGSSYTGTAVVPSCIGCHKTLTPPSNAPHAGNWATYLANPRSLNHSTVNESNAPACAQCHTNRANLSAAGIINANKFSTNALGQSGCFNNTLCHKQAGHELPYITGHQAGAKANLASCQACHVNLNAGGANPRFNKSLGTGVLSSNGCEGCHNKPGIAHPYMWLTGRGVVGQQSASHANAGTVNASCGQCHGGTALSGGGAGYLGGIAPPSCFPSSSINGTVCHVAKPVDSQGITVGCVSCHAYPPNDLGPVGPTSPNRNGKHSAHFSKITTGLGCADCHGPYGSPRTDHATQTTAQLSIATKFTDSVVAYASPTCSAVSCHGGQTVDWTRTTSLGCLDCHHLVDTVGNVGGQYINVFSGDRETPIDPTGTVNYPFSNLHMLHSESTGPTRLTCTQCHDITKLSSRHFINILSGNTKTLLPGDAAVTLGGGTTRIATYTYPGTAGRKSDCFTNGAGCHGSTAKSWYQ